MLNGLILDFKLRSASRFEAASAV